MNEKLDSCTCPSGDGSLRHPCPAHPATLATAKHGGCVQLGSEERVRFEVWAHGECLSLHRWPHSGEYSDDRSSSAWKAWQFVLSAQPSPGGQDVLFIEELAELRRLVPSVNQKQALDAAIAALAARQPVEFERAIPTRRRESAVEPLLELGFVWNNQRWENRRQPVGEVVEYQSYHGYGGGQWSTCDKKLYDNGKAFEAKYGAGQMSLYRALVVGDAAPPAQQPAQVYLDGLDRALGEAIDQRDRYHEVADDLAGHIASITGVDMGEHSSTNCPWQNAIEAAEEYKPAQAVDLGPLRSLARSWIVEAGGTVADTKHACADELLTLIDSQA